MSGMKIKVVYIINYAPNYRDVFLREFGKYVDLTVISFNGKPAKLKDPKKRIGYKFLELPQKKFLGISWQVKEFTKASGDYDIVLVGYNLRNPLRMLNLIRGKRVILEGMIYGKNNNWFIRLSRRLAISLSEGVLVYSQIIKDKLEKEVSKPIISFNNTSFSKSEINPLPFSFKKNELNLVWVGRYQLSKKVERLIEIAQKDKRINIRIIGPGILDIFEHQNLPENVSIYDEKYGSELTDHFKWAHAVFNPGSAGLIVMNTARFGRPIFIDGKSHNGPEIQLVMLAGSDLVVDFDDLNDVRKLIDKCILDRAYLEEKGKIICNIMKDQFTVEYMAQQYYKAIVNDWD